MPFEEPHTNAPEAAGSTEPRRAWHVMLRGLQRGPYTRAELRELLDKHVDGWDAPVWRPGQGDWMPAHEARALLSAHAADSARPVALETFAEMTITRPERLHSAHSRAAGETTLQMRAFVPTRWPARTSLLTMALGGILLALAGALVYRQLNPLEHPKPAPRPPLGALQATPATPAMARRQAEPAAASLASAPPGGQDQRRSEPPVDRSVPSRISEPASAQTRDDEPKAMSVRIGSPWAPIRVSALARAEVVCSLPHGTQLSVLAQRHGSKARWFEVRCDADTVGWVHENHLAAVQR